MLRSHTLTQSLTPVQEKAVLGVDFAQVTDPAMVESSDSTFVALQRLGAADEATFKVWFDTSVQNQYSYATALVAIDYLLERGAIGSEAALVRLVGVELGDLPSFSNLLAWQHLKRVLDRLSRTHFAGVGTFDTFEAAFPKSKAADAVMHKVVFYLAGYFHFATKPAELKKLCASLETYFVNQSASLKFPKAASSNNAVVNPVLNLVAYLWRKPGVRLDASKALNGYLQVTYHNGRVAKLTCLNAIKLGHVKECVAAFKTYVNYVSDFKVKHKGVYDDVVDTISLYAVVLGFLSQKMTTYDEYREVAAHAETLDILVQDYLIYFVGEDSRYYIPELQSYLNFVYTLVADVYERSIPFGAAPLPDSVDAMVRKTTRAIKAVYKTDEVDRIRLGYNFYKNAYYLHKSGDDVAAVKRTKRALLNDPNNVGYLTFLVKLYSGNEETCGLALDLARDVVTNALLLPNPGLQARADIAEAYLVYLTLLKESAFAKLGDLFAVLNGLFDNQFKELHVKPHLARAPAPHPEAVRTSARAADAECVPCEPKSKRFFSTGTIRRKPSMTVSKPVNSAPATAPNHIVTPELRVISRIWLDISRLLQGMDALEDALEAVNASEALTPSADADARRGCIMLAMGDQQGLVQLERALEHSSAGISTAEAAMGLYVFGGEPAAQARAHALAQELVQTVPFARDGHLLLVVGVLSKAVDAWCGLKIL